MNGFTPSTIVALTTAAQNAGVGIVRLSGSSCLDIVKTIFRTPSGKLKTDFKTREVYFGSVVDEQNQLLDHCLCVYWKAPQSFTGEDVVELHCHGNVHLLRSVIRRILEVQSFGEVRLAEPGEFSKRAFLNGKMDLTQAEAVHDLVNAQSEMAVKANLANLDGVLSQEVNELKERLLNSLALIEASFEFPEEDIQLYDSKEVFYLLQGVLQNLYRLLEAFKTSKLYDVGVKVSLVGEPNVGKSSVLNAILNENRAIVTDIAGTTRDIVQGVKMINGLRFEFSDTAGLRETLDKVEYEGIQRSILSAENSDLVLYITDNPNEKSFKIFSQVPHLHVLNKSDLHFNSVQNLGHSNFSVIISAINRLGISELENLIYKSVVDTQHTHSLHVNERQHQMLSQAYQSVQSLILDFESLKETELLAEELRFIISKLDEITGQITSHDVLGEIFKRFCIGK